MEPAADIHAAFGWIRPNAVSVIFKCNLDTGMELVSAQSREFFQGMLAFYGGRSYTTPLYKNYWMGGVGYGRSFVWGVI